jgi:fumarate hydratase subunit alpha
MAEPREIDATEITRVVRDLCIEINYKVPEEMVRLVKRARELEESPLGRQVLDLLIRNQELAAEGEYPYCQDTGYTVIFLDLGQDVHVTGTDLYDAVNEGVRQGYGDGYLRGSIVRDPLFDRRNTGDNTPAFIHTRVVPGDQVRIQVDAKGAGSENMGKHAMLKPADGLEGAKEFVLQAVADSGPNACPPGIIGVGIGGNFEMSAVIAKRALMRKVGQPNPDPRSPSSRPSSTRSATRSGSDPRRSAARRRCSPCTSRRCRPTSPPCPSPSTSSATRTGRARG